MKLSEKLEANFQAGLFTMMTREDCWVNLFSTRSWDGSLRNSGWFFTEGEAIKSQGSNCGYSTGSIDVLVKRDNWSIFRTIHPTELLPCDYKKGDKVRIKANTKEMCERVGLSWGGNMGQMLKDGFGFIKDRVGTDWEIWDKKEVGWYIFPPSVLEPYFEDEEDVMVWIVISKKSLEELRKKGIKVIEN